MSQNDQNPEDDHKSDGGPIDSIYGLPIILASDAEREQFIGKGNMVLLPFKYLGTNTPLADIPIRDLGHVSFGQFVDFIETEMRRRGR